MKKYLILTAAALMVMGCCNNRSSDHPGEITAGEHTRVKTTYGTVEGYLDGDIYTFKGIQYAKAERFKSPEYPDKFDGIRMCKIYGPQAPQNETLTWTDNTQTDYAFGNNFVVEPMDEQDCLVLNVWTKGINDGKKRPVFVWIHGGGYSSGSGHDLPCYDQGALAAKGDIVGISINHRLNVLGFMNLTALGGEYSNSVNLGMQDMVKALEWVRDNIEKFGGDPGCVTIAGQSGGGGKIGSLMGMPSAHGLFHRAIIQSGISTLTIADNEATQKTGLAFVEELGLTPAVFSEKINDYSYEELVAAANRASQKAPAGGFSQGPVADGKIIPFHPFGEGGLQISEDIPLLIGTNFNEFTFDISEKLTEEEAEARLAERIGASMVPFYVQQFKKSYPEEGPEAMLYMDTMFRGGTIGQAAAKSRLGKAPTYLYQFMWKPENNVLGASHGMELPFMSCNVAKQREMTGSSDSAYKLEEIISNYWLAFIKTGDPNVKGQVRWEPYDENSGACMMLDNVCEIRYNHDKMLVELLQGDGNGFNRAARSGSLFPTGNKK